MKSTIEQVTAENLRAIIFEESKRMIHKQEIEELTPGDIAKLEKLAKSYSILAAEQRESLKNGLGNMSDDELNSLADNLNKSSDPAEDGSDPEDE